MKLSTLTWLAAIIVMVYYLTSLGEAYYQAVYAWQDARNAQIVKIMNEGR